MPFLGVRVGVPMLSQGAGGAASGPAVDLNFATGTYTGGTLASMLANTNSTGGYVTNADGSLTLIGANLLRIGTAGLLIEGAATNLVLNSQDFTQASWSQSINGGGSVSITLAAGTAPDGTNTANLITINRPASTSAARLNGTFTGTAAAYTGDLYVKASTGSDVGKSISVVFYNGSAVAGVVNITLTANWQLAAITETLAASASCQFIFGYLESTLGGNSQTGTTNFLAWQADVHLGSFVTSPIKTTSSSASRSADNVVASGALATLLARSTASIIVKTNSSQQSLGGTLVDANGVILLGKTSGNIGTTAVGAALSTGNTGTWTGVNDLGLAWDGTGGILQLNGGTAATDSTARTPSATFHIGSTSGSSAFFYGYITELIGYNSKQASPQ